MMQVGAEPDFKNRWRGVGLTLRIVVSVGVLSWLAWRTDWPRTQDAMGQLRFEWWLLAVGVYFVAQLASALRWQLLARPLGFREPYRHFAAFYFIGMYFNLFLPTSVGGDVIRAWKLDAQSGWRLAALLSVFVDRLSGLFVLVLVACVGAAACPAPFPEWARLGAWGVGLGAPIGVSFVLLLSRALARFPLTRRIADGMGFYWRHPRVLLLTSGLSVVIQLANVLLVWLVGRSLELDVPFLYCAVFVPLVTLLTLLPVSLNGMGIREGGTVLFLSAVGIGEGSALCLSILWFLAMTAVSLCGGIPYLLGWVNRPEVDANHENLRGHSDQGRSREPAAAA